MSSTEYLAAAAAAVVVALACGLAGYRLGTRHTTTLRTVLGITVHAANHDPLTGLLHRRQLAVRLGQLDQQREPVVLAIVNLDRFADANRFGHRVGDQLLVLQAARLRYAAAQHAGTVYRLLADEFAVVWPAPPAAATTLAADLLAALAEPVELLVADHPIDVQVAATAGVTTSDRMGGGDPTSRLLARADTALQHGKLAARGAATLWQPQLPDLPRPRRDGRSGDPQAGAR